MFSAGKPTRRKTLDHGAASAISIDVLSFLSESPDLLQRFLQLSGLEAHQVRSAAGDPAFFVSLLDFVLAHEPTLLSFSAHADLPPERVVEARRLLAGERSDHE